MGHPTTSQSGTVGWPRAPRWYVVLVLGLAVLWFGTQAVAIWLPVEDWPLTSAPMFAHYRSRGMAKFHFRFMGRFLDGQTREVRAADVRLRDYGLMRLFFGRYYGSVDPRWPHGHLGPDSPARFRDRLRRFFAALTTELGRFRPRWAPLVSIDLRLRKVQRGRPDEERLVGRYDVASREFTHLWTPDRPAGAAP